MNGDDARYLPCTWREVRKVKTFDGKCLERKGFREACGLDNGYPFTKAYAVFNQAFESDDESIGGCPPISNE